MVSVIHPETFQEMQWIVPDNPETAKTEKKEYSRAIVLNSEGQILVIQRKTEASFEGGKWELPGGKLDNGEIHDDALLRELFEETGLVGQLVEQTPMVDERKMETGNNAHGGKIARTETKVVLVDDTKIDFSKLQTESMAAK